MASFRFLSTLVGKSLFYLYRLLSVSPSVLSVSSSFCLSVCLICIFFLSLPLSICLSVCLIFLFFLSLSLSICLTLCLICLFFFLSGLCLSFSPSVYLSLPLYICLTLSLSYISICLTRLIYVPMSLCLFSGYFFVCVFVCLSAWLFFISFRLPVASSAFLFVFIFFCMSPCLLVSLPACLSVFLSLRMSASFVLSYLSGKIVIWKARDCNNCCRSILPCDVLNQGWWLVAHFSVGYRIACFFLLYPLILWFQIRAFTYVFPFAVLWIQIRIGSVFRSLWIWIRIPNTDPDSHM